MLDFSILVSLLESDIVRLSEEPFVAQDLVINNLNLLKDNNFMRSFKVQHLQKIFVKPILRQTILFRSVPNTSLLTKAHNSGDKEDSGSNNRKTEKSFFKNVAAWVAGGGAVSIAYKFYEEHKKDISHGLIPLQQDANNIFKELANYLDNNKILHTITRNELKSKSLKEIYKQQKELEVWQRQLESLAEATSNLFYLPWEALTAINIGLASQANSLHAKIVHNNARIAVGLKILCLQEQYLCNEHAKIKKEIDAALQKPDKTECLASMPELRQLIQNNFNSELENRFLNESTSAIWNIYGLSAWDNNDYLNAFKSYEKAYSSAINPMQKAIVQVNSIRTMLKLINFVDTQQQQEIFSHINNLCKEVISVGKHNSEVNLCCGIALAVQGDEGCFDFFNRSIFLSKIQNNTAISYYTKQLINSNKDQEALEELGKIKLNEQTLKDGPLFFNRGIAKFNTSVKNDPTSKGNAIKDIRIAKMLLKGEESSRDAKIAECLNTMMEKNTIERFESNLFEWSIDKSKQDQHVTDKATLEKVITSFKDFANLRDTAHISLPSRKL